VQARTRRGILRADQQGIRTLVLNGLNDEPIPRRARRARLNLARGCARPGDPRACAGLDMRKDVREFIRRLEAVGLTVESTPGHYRVMRDGKPLRKANGMPFMLPFSPDTIRWRRTAIVELRKLDIHL
jgi:hypothetical protein